MNVKDISFCDWKPCTMLQQAVVMFLDPAWRPGEDIRFKIMDRSIGGVARIVYLSYCPFCGTRIRNNKDVLGWVESLPRRP